jgi:aspartate aminotransferase-like enzyme
MCIASLEYQGGEAHDLAFWWLELHDFDIGCVIASEKCFGVPVGVKIFLMSLRTVEKCGLEQSISSSSLFLPETFNLEDLLEVGVKKIPVESLGF